MILMGISAVGSDPSSHRLRAFNVTLSDAGEENEGRSNNSAVELSRIALADQS
jgi:hypothetical protein